MNSIVTMPQPSGRSRGPRPLVARASGSCVECDYPLDHLPLDATTGVGRCPECGRVFRSGHVLVVSGWPTPLGFDLGAPALIVSCIAVAALVAAFATSAFIALAIVGVGGFTFTLARIAWHRSKRRGGSIEWVVDQQGVTERSLGRVIGFRAWTDVEKVEARARRRRENGPWLELVASAHPGADRRVREHARSHGRPPDELHGRRRTPIDDARSTAERLESIRISSIQDPAIERA